MVCVRSVHTACHSRCGNGRVGDLNAVNGDRTNLLIRRILYRNESSILTGYGDVVQLDVLDLGSSGYTTGCALHQGVSEQRVSNRCVLDGVALTVEVCPESIRASLLRNQGLELAALRVDVVAKENGLAQEALARDSDQIPILNAVDREGINRIVIDQVKCQTILADCRNKTVCIGLYRYSKLIGSDCHRRSDRCFQRKINRSAVRDRSNGDVITIWACSESECLRALVIDPRRIAVSTKNIRT